MKRAPLLILCAISLVWVAALKSPPPPPSGSPVLGLDGKPDTLPDAAFVETVRKHCSKCHVPPQPQYVPRGAWRARIAEMAQWSLAGTRTTPGDESALWQMDLAPFIRYFEARAPLTLPAPVPWPPGNGGLRLARWPLVAPGEARPPMLANVRLFDLDGDGRPEIVACDMGRGVVMLGQASPPGVLREIARIPYPDHAEMVDLDRDGKRDLLIADLGDLMPSDHEKGSVVWLRQTEPLQFQAMPLIQKIPRTADVQAADFDGDGDLDLVVAAFGWHTVGGIYLYLNQTTDWKHPTFEGIPVDPRAGGIHVPPADLNGDGKMDFVALVSQEHEHVVAFLNLGPGKGFRSETIFRAEVPVWGSSGIQIVDLDGDRDLDLLMTNGDTLDDFTVRPFHGVRWFENEGGYPWKRHDLVAMPGVHRAQAADMDGDGDLDVVAAAFLPNAEHLAFQPPEGRQDLAPLTSIGWIEQVKPRVFVPHPLEQARLAHATLDLGDIDGDGDVDVVTGNFVGFSFVARGIGAKVDAAVDVWVNQAPP